MSINYQLKHLNSYIEMGLPSGIASSQELLEAQAHVWNQAYSFINSMSLKCAIQLGIPDAIEKHGKPMTLSQLSDTVAIYGTKTDSFHRLMRVLVHSKFFHKVKTEDEDEEAYSLTPASRLLLEDEPLSAVPQVRSMLDPTLTELWHNLSKWFRNDSDTPFFSHHGRSVWEYMAADEGLNVLLNKSLASDAGFVASVLMNECKHVFHGLKLMVDVGGGTGAMAKAVTAAIPGLKCVVLDLPHVVAGRQPSENVTYLSGDMFDFIPKADAVFLKWLLHDWNEEECVRILKKCKEAISSNNNAGKGKVILVEMVLEDENETYEQTETKLFFDMQMVAITTGKERTEKEWAKIFSAAGFADYKITRLLGLRSVIEVFP